MAFTLAELVVKIRADDSKLRRALPQLRRGVERVQTSLRKMGQIARTAFNKMAAGLKRAAQAMAGMARYARLALLAVGGVIALTIKQASTAEEMHAKFMTVFREEGDAVSKWAAQYGKAVGRSKVDMETWLATIQDTFVPLGISRREATKLSKTIVKLGIDIASFNEKADVDVINNLQSALVGQTRAVLNYGIVVNEAAVKQEVLRMGVRKAWTDVSLATKVQARMNVILRSSTDAQGDAIRTINSFANQAKMLMATLKDASAVIGRAFFPSVIRLMASVRGMIAPIGRWVQHNQKLTATIGLVTVGVLGLLSVLPLLVAGLAVLAAHPVLAAIIAMGAAAAATAVYFYAMKAAAVEAFAFERPLESIKQLEGRLDQLHTLLAGARDDLEKSKELKTGLARGLVGQQAMREIETYTAAIERLTPRLVLLRSAEEAATRAREKATVAAEKAGKAIATKILTETEIAAAKKAKETWEETFKTIAHSRLTAHKLALALLQDQVRAMATAAKEAGVFEQEKANIARYYAEEQETLKKKFAEQESERRKKVFWDIIRENEAREAKVQARARELAGPARAGSAISGIAAFARQIQEAVFRAGENAAQKRRDIEKVKLARDQLTQQELMVALLTKFTPGLSLGP